jgi:biotin operon repressor
MSREKYSKTINKKSQLQLELRGIEFVDLEELAKKFGVNKRTLKRGIEDIEEDGIIVEKKKGKNNLYRIYDIDQASLPKFNEDEFNTITSQIKDLDGIGDLITSKLLKLIYFNLEDFGNYKSEIEIIKNSKKNNTKFLIKKYYGRDRISYDLKLTAAKLDVQNKKVFVYNDNRETFFTYNIENMEKVESLIDTADAYPPYEPKPENLDVFGFNFYGKKIEVELMLTKFAKSQLIRQFPIMEKHLITIKKDPYYALLKITVHDIQPIARFVTGLFNEIKIEGNNKAKEEIKKYYYDRVENGFKNNYSNK